MKKLEENPVYKRQIELLRKKYQVDDEKKIVHLSLTYDKASEMLLNDHNFNDYHEISPDIIERISETITHIPLGYKTDIEFKVMDYENFKPASIMESFNDYFEENHYSGYGEIKKKTLQIAFLLLAGILLLILKVSIRNAAWINEGITKEILLEIIEISGWVFIWESVSIMFLSPSEDRMRSIRYKRKLNNISFFDKDGNRLISETSNDVFSQWVEETKIHKIEKYSLLIGGTGLVGVGFSNLITIIATASSNDWGDSKAGYIVSLVMTVLFAIFYIIGGLAAIATYSKRWKIRRFLTAFGIINCFIVLIEVIYLIYSFSTNTEFSVRALMSAIFSFIFNFFYLVGFVTNLRLNNFKSSDK